MSNEIKTAILTELGQATKLLQGLCSTANALTIAYDTEELCDGKQTSEVLWLMENGIQEVLDMLDGVGSAMVEMQGA